MPLSFFGALTKLFSSDSRPGPAIHANEKTSEELALEKNGNLNSLQRYRYLTHKQTTYEHPIPIGELLEVEEDLRHMVQHEQVLLEENDQSKGSQEKLQATNKTIWILTREWWKHRSEFGGGVVSRAFDVWRSHPGWYMHQTLVADCVGKQGCCSRGCGCCAKRQTDSTRELGVGHCTIKCGCCRKARGFELSKEEQSMVYGYFDYQEQGNFYDLIELASIWGLRYDNYDNPFNMIRDGDYEDEDDESNYDSDFGSDYESEDGSEYSEISSFCKGDEGSATTEACEWSTTTKAREW